VQRFIPEILKVPKLAYIKYGYAFIAINPTIGIIGKFGAHLQEQASSSLFFGYG